MNTISIKLHWYLLSISFLFFLMLASQSQALSTTELNDISTDQELINTLTGKYEPITDKKSKYQVHTYETLCTGYIIIEDQGDTINYYGYGDLADQFTYKKSIDKKDTASSTVSTATTTNDKTPKSSTSSSTIPL